MGKAALLLPLLEELIGSSFGGSKTTFQHFEKPIGPEQHMPFNPRLGLFGGQTSQEFAKQGEKSRAFFTVHQDKANKVSIEKFASHIKKATKVMTAIAVTKELVMLPDRIAKWGQSLVESQRDLSQFSGTIAKSVGEFDRRGLIRDISSAQATGKSTEFLADSISDLLDEIRPIKDMIGNSTRRLVGALAKYTEFFIKFNSIALQAKGTEAIADAILEAFGIERKRPEEGMDMTGFQTFWNEAKKGNLEDFVPLPRI